MVKQEIVEKISKYFRLTQFEAEKIFDDIFSIIIQGVKEDNIVDVANFGEFIIKYDSELMGSLSNNHYKKTVEFLASSSLEDELNENVPGKIVTGSVSENVVSQERNELSEETSGTEDAVSKSSVEDELRRKREALLSKISIHPLQDAEQERMRHGVESPVILPSSPPVREQVEAKQEVPQREMETAEKGPVARGEPRIPGAETQTEAQDKMEKPSEFEEDLSKKSFSDYFAEVKETGTPKPGDEETAQLPEEFEGGESEPAAVLPKAAIDLHNEITGTGQESAYVGPTPEPPGFPAEESYKSKPEDKSYYIWYKDSESSPAETQNLSYEYELLYQATKEAEYKSKLKIYVTTFILFFSIVLILLIFSPVIYKIFFTPIELQSIENLREDAGMNESSFEQEAFKIPKPTVTQQQSEKQKVQEQEQMQAPPQGTEQMKEKESEQLPVTEEPKIEGLTENSMGWTDEKLKVIYVRLDNGKYAIQESSWDSEEKANKRISLIDSYKISGLKGSIARIEVSGKGTWHRVRLGEFSTVQEARKKAEELRNKIKS